MRIGLFTDQFSAGLSGQTTSVMMLYNYFKEHGHECFIFTSHSRKLADADPNVVNLPGIPYPMKNLRNYRFSPFLKRHIKVIAFYDFRYHTRAYRVLSREHYACGKKAAAYPRGVHAAYHVGVLS